MLNKTHLNFFASSEKTLIGFQSTFKMFRDFFSIICIHPREWQFWNSCTEIPSCPVPANRLRSRLT